MCKGEHTTVYLFTYSYPGCCVLKAPPLVYQDRDTHVTTAAFIADLHSRMPSICGEKTTFSSTRAYNTVSMLSAASCSTLQHPGQSVNVTPCAEPGTSSSQHVGSASGHRAALGSLNKDSSLANDVVESGTVSQQRSKMASLSASIGKENNWNPILGSSSAPDVMVLSTGSQYASQQQASDRVALSSASNRGSTVLGSSSSQEVVGGVPVSIPQSRVEWLSVQHEPGAGQTITPIFGRQGNPDKPTKRAGLSLSGRGKQTQPPAKKTCPTAPFGRTPQDGSVNVSIQGSVPYMTHTTAPNAGNPPTMGTGGTVQASTMPALGAAATGVAALPTASAVSPDQQLPQHIMKKVRYLGFCPYRYTI